MVVPDNKDVAAGSGVFELIEELLLARVDKEERLDYWACGTFMEPGFW
jgi:hypothetical protein